MSQHPDHGADASTAPENYQRYFVPAIGAPLAEDLVDAAGLLPGERVLDVACGTGVVARLAAEAVGASGSVAGLDLHPGMLAVARATTPSGQAIAWHEGNAEAMPLPDEAFDAVLCQMGLQFLPDRPKALGEMRRVLAPGGRVALNVPGPTPPMFAIMGEALARHVGPEAAGFVDHVFALHDPAELRELLDEAGFRDVSVQVATRTLDLPAPEDFLWQYVHSTPLTEVVGQVDAEGRDALERDIVTKWREFVRNGTLKNPLRVVVATGRRQRSRRPGHTRSGTNPGRRDGEAMGNRAGARPAGAND